MKNKGFKTTPTSPGTIIRRISPGRTPGNTKLTSKGGSRSTRSFAKNPKVGRSHGGASGLYDN